MNKKILGLLGIIFLNLIVCRVDSVKEIEILRSGDGEIGIKGSISTGKWPEGFSFPRSSGSYKVTRLNHSSYPQPEPRVLSTWNPGHFTSLKDLPVGTRLDKFKFIVHGLEIESSSPQRVDLHAHPTMLDKFVRKQLNPLAPSGDDFIKFYPYFFHKKTMVSASVISENLTAVGGKAGFVLSVPPLNLVACGPHDIWFPLDAHFYTRDQLSPSCPYTSFGEAIMEDHTSRYGLMPLERVLPPTEIRIDDYREDVPFPIKDREKHALDVFRIMGNSEEEAKHLLKIEKQADPFLKNIDNTDKVTEFGPLGCPNPSWYNEVTINPSRGDTNTSVTINGIFLRTSRDQLELYKRLTHVQALFKVAESFNLPVMFIENGKAYGLDPVLV